MESDEAARRSYQRLRNNETGKSFDASQLSTFTYTKEWERRIMAAPLSPNQKQQLQNPDGSFQFMPGLDPIS
jgi:hypothetical protein